MWWNFIGREHDEVVGYRAQWEALLAEGDHDPVRASPTTTRSRPCTRRRCPTRGWSSADREDPALAVHNVSDLPRVGSSGRLTCDP